ncbi:SMAD/FHA domain-containing protein [Zea mays]|uniref:SMAD/FHA domain-containing protein n=1 Tax=Zea mays TaxID=4577 RepID=A0A1D6KWM2_MAIZE|nr:SMAD/FHA domain-containing protein [Zea mays]
MFEVRRHGLGPAMRRGLSGSRCCGGHLHGSILHLCKRHGAMSEAAGDVVEQMWEQCGFSFICGKKTGVEGSTSWRGKLKQDVDGIYVIDLGSVHGTFVANERLTKDNPVELEVGQSLRFAASTRIYILRKNTAALFPTPSLPSDVSLPSPPDPNDEDAVVAYNTVLNRYGISKSDILSSSKDSSGSASSGANDDKHAVERPLKRSKKRRVSFRDQAGGELTQVVGISDGADVETEPGPIGVKEGSLVGKYESLVQVTVIPKGKEQASRKDFTSTSPSGVTDKLQEVLKRVKSTTRPGIYDDLYGDSIATKVGSSWAYKSDDLSGEDTWHGFKLEFSR